MTEAEERVVKVLDVLCFTGSDTRSGFADYRCF
jgi:hypothetical protein